ncbi:MAG: 50S ribosomal protein L23 [Candidatus Bilamarchaeaceae archaeon]
MIIEGPLKTEKSLQLIEKENSIRFFVSERATKKDIKAEVEKLFGVKVVAVRTLIDSNGKKQAIVKLDKNFKADEIAAKLKMIA